jgi:hypothetical protein
VQDRMELLARGEPDLVPGRPSGARQRNGDGRARCCRCSRKGFSCRSPISLPMTEYLALIQNLVLITSLCARGLGGRTDLSWGD